MIGIHMSPLVTHDDLLVEETPERKIVSICCTTMKLGVIVWLIRLGRIIYSAVISMLRKLKT
jgi:hypothetical protein